MDRPSGSGGGPDAETLCREVSALAETEREAWLHARRQDARGVLTQVPGQGHPALRGPMAGQGS